MSLASYLWYQNARILDPKVPGSIPDSLVQLSYNFEIFGR